MTGQASVRGTVPDGHARPRLLAAGDNVVDQYPQQGVMYPGGNAVNVAVHARRLGADSAYLGVLGTDRAGEVVRSALLEEGVATSLTRVVEGPNARAVVEVVEGNRVFLEGHVGVSVFEPSLDDLRAMARYDIVHTGECSNLESQLPQLAAAAQLLSFDFSERPWDYVEQYAGHARVAVWSAPSGDLQEARRQAERLRSLGPETAVVTLGPAGAVVLQEQLVHRPAPRGQVVDTLGAGDAFIARFLVGLARGEEVGTLLDAATAYATASCASYGAFGHAASLTPSTTPI